MYDAPWVLHNVHHHRLAWQEEPAALRRPVDVHDHVSAGPQQRLLSPAHALHTAYAAGMLDMELRVMELRVMGVSLSGGAARALHSR